MAIDLGVSRSCLRLVPMLHIVHGSLYFQFLFFCSFVSSLLFVRVGKLRAGGMMQGYNPKNCWDTNERNKGTPLERP